jgi:hypothetical protein
MKPSAMGQIVDIAGRLRPLADFYRVHKPEVQSIFLFTEDFKLLQRWPKLAKRHGFTFHGEHIFYGSYKLVASAVS